MLGVGLLAGGSVSVPVLAAVVISSVPEGLSSAAGMKRNGRSARYVFGVWGGIAVVSGLAALICYVALGGAPPFFPRSLEIGAGTGYFSLHLLKAGIVGEATCTDISPGMLDTLRANAGELGLTVETVARALDELPDGVRKETLGPVDVPDAGVRAIVRFDYASGHVVAQVLRSQVIRAATERRKAIGSRRGRGLPTLRVRFDDVEPFTD